MEKAIIITAPSGAGKTTLVKLLLAKRTDIEFSVSACTRGKRPTEVNGKDYYFLSAEEFRSKIQANAFLEYEEVYNDMYYGTLESEVERIWEEDQAVIFDIDVKGAVHLKEKLGDKALSIFIAPPNIETLLERLQGRNTESEETLAIRYDKAKLELAYREKMDTVIVNDNLETAYEALEDLVDDFLY